MRLMRCLRLFSFFISILFKAVCTMASIQFEDQIIDYTLIRKNVKNINLRINTCGEVTVSAPPYVPADVVKRFVFSNAQKIISARKRFSQFSDMTVKYENGDFLYILGKKYRLQIAGADKNRCVLNSDDVIFYVGENSDVNLRRALYDKLLADTAQKVFPQVMQDCLPLFYGRINSVPCLKIRRMKSQWGNCRAAKNTVTLNSRLAAYDENVIKSVVCHELCHFIHQNHSKKFYSCLSGVLPEWKKYDAVLKNKLIYCYFIDNQ